MTTSRQKAVGSAAERKVAAMLGGHRVGMDGGPVDVVVPGHMTVQVKNLKAIPSTKALMAMLEAMPWGETYLRSVVVIERAGRGRRGLRTITFDLDEWVQWHGSLDTEGDAGEGDSS